MTKGFLKLTMCSHGGKTVVLINPLNISIIGTPIDQSKGNSLLNLNHNGRSEEIYVEESLNELEAMLKIVESVGLPKTLYGEST